MGAARLMLFNVTSVKAYRVMRPPKSAQVALFFGVEGLDGTAVPETICRMAGAETARMLPTRELERVVREAGFVPVERDTLYNETPRVS